MQACLNGGWFLNMFVLCDSICVCADTAGLSVLVLHHRDEFLWFFTVQCGCRRKTEGDYAPISVFPFHLISYEYSYIT